MTDYVIGYFKSFFESPNALGVGLAVAFGAIWLACYWPSVFRRPWVWAVLVSSAFLTLAAVCFIQIPLQVWAGQALNHFWSQEALMRWILLAAVPQMLLTGLVQEGAKLVPVVIYWRRSGKSLDPKLGLIIGAVAGAGFAIFEARWVLSQWTWELVQTYGYVALLGFWERFFTVAAHIGLSALAGYGLAKGWGWQFYLIAAFLHGLLNYSAVFGAAGLFTEVHSEIYIAVLAVAISAWALWLRWRKTTIPAVLPVASTSGVPQ